MEEVYEKNKDNMSSSWTVRNGSRTANMVTCNISPKTNSLILVTDVQPPVQPGKYGSYLCQQEKNEKVLFPFPIK